MTSTAIVVLGLPRSGTSCVAGCLHKMGVDMGEGHLQIADDSNPRGYYEDLRWQLLNKQITGVRYGTEEPQTISVRQRAEYRALAFECAKLPLWGMKDPRLCFTFQWVAPALLDAGARVKVVAVYRHPESVAASLKRHSEVAYRGKHRMTIEEARELHDEWARAMTRRLKEWRGEVLAVPYESLLRGPALTVGELADFAFRGTRARLDLKAGIAFVDERLNHHG